MNFVYKLTKMNTTTNFQFFFGSCLFIALFFSACNPVSNPNPDPPPVIQTSGGIKKYTCPDLCPIVHLELQVGNPDNFLIMVDFLDGSHGIFTPKDQKIVSSDKKGNLVVENYGKGNFSYSPKGDLKSEINISGKTYSVNVDSFGNIKVR